METVCPSQNELKSLSLGRLSDEQSDRLLAHLHACQPCQSEMGTLEFTEDTFVEQLRTISDDVEGGDLNDEFSSETECRIASARALGALAEVETGTATHPNPNVPRNIGEYEIVRPLGHGGMGHVYLGRHTKLGRKVAIKFIAEHRRWDKNMHERFASEMRTIGSLNHPNIVVAHDAREVDGLAVLVTEFIDGMDVSELLRRNGQLSIADSSAVIQAVCEALTYIDSKNLVHRDIKPSNVMIDQDGSVKLLDLGLARLQVDDSPILGSLEVGDLVDFIGIPAMQSEEFKTGTWPDLLLRKIKVREVSKVDSSQKQVIKVELTEHESLYLQPATVGYKTRCRLHDNSRYPLLRDFREIEGAWRVVLWREEGKTTTDNLDIPRVFRRNRMAVVSQRKGVSQFSMEFQKYVGGFSREILDTFRLYKIGRKGGSDMESPVRQSIYRILKSGRLEIASTAATAAVCASSKFETTIVGTSANVGSDFNWSSVSIPSEPSRSYKRLIRIKSNESDLANSMAC